MYMYFYMYMYVLQIWNDESDIIISQFPVNSDLLIPNPKSELQNLYSTLCCSGFYWFLTRMLLPCKLIELAVKPLRNCQVVSTLPPNLDLLNSNFKSEFSNSKYKSLDAFLWECTIVRLDTMFQGCVVPIWLDLKSDGNFRFLLQCKTQFSQIPTVYNWNNHAIVFHNWRMNKVHKDHRQSGQ